MSTSFNFYSMEQYSQVMALLNVNLLRSFRYFAEPKVVNVVRLR